MAAKYRYPGTKPFSLDEQSIFFGRDEDIAGLRTSIIVNPATVLFGRSGTGKSSIIQAGLIPLLTRTGEADEEDAAPYAPYLPLNIIPKPFDENRPLSANSPNSTGPTPPPKNLWSTICQILQANIPQDTALFPPGSASVNTSSLWYLLKQFQYGQFQTGRRQVLLLIFDQAEELFTYPDHQVEELVQQLAPVVSQFIPEEYKRYLNAEKNHLPPALLRVCQTPVPVKFLFSIRSDKLHLITRLKRVSPQILQNSCELLPLSRAAAFDAIEKPSQLAGDFLSPCFRVADSTMESIFSQLSSDNGNQDYNSEESRIDPFSLQIVCSHIEQKIVPQDADKVIEPQELPDIRKIINGYYHDCISNLPVSEAEKTNVRNFIEFRLISNSRRIPIHEDLITGDEKYPVSKEVLRMLVAVRILKADISPAGGWIYEITHDSFIQPILEARARRMEPSLDDRSRDTITDLLNRVREREGVRGNKDGLPEKSAGAPQSSVSGGSVEDLELYDLYKKLGDAYILIREYIRAVPWYNRIINGPDIGNRPFLIETYRARSGAFYSMEEYDPAIADLKTILQLNPDDHSAIVYLIDYSDRQNRLEEAIGWIETTCNITRDNAGIFTEIGNKYLSRREYDKASQFYQKTLALSPRDSNACRNLGIVEEARQNLDQAMTWYSKALELCLENNEKPATNYNDIGNIYFAQKDYDNARAQYRNALSHDPGFYYSLFNLGYMAEKQNNPEKAIEYFNKALEVNPGYDDALLGLTRMYMALGDYAQTKGNFLKMNKSAVTPETWYFRLGYIEEKFEQWTEAVSNYREALRLNPRHTDTLNNLSELFLRRGNYPEALDLCQQLIALDPAEEKTYRNRMGRVYYAQREMEKAIAEYQRAIDLDPGTAANYYNMGLAWKSIDPEKAIGYYQKAIELDPEDMDNRDNLTLLYINLGRYEEALRTSEEAGRVAPRSPYPLSNRGLVYSHQGRFEEALPYYDQALALGSTDAQLFSDRGFVNRQLENFEAALRDYSQCILLQPGKAAYYNSRGYIYRTLGNYEAALADFRMAIEKDPDWGYAYTGLASTCFLMQDYEGSIGYAQQALNLTEKNLYARAIVAASYRLQGLKSSCQEQVRLIGKFKAGWDDTPYTKACIEALCENEEQAMQFLTEALKKRDVSRIFARRDGSFYLYRRTAVFIALVGEDPQPPSLPA